MPRVTRTCGVYRFHNLINHKVSDSLKGHIPWNTGTKGIVRSWNKGMEMNAQVRANISAAHKGIVYPSRQKAVVQIDPNNGIVSYYKSITAAERATNAHSVGACCRGVWKTSRGYIWQYA